MSSTTWSITPRCTLPTKNNVWQYVHVPHRASTISRTMDSSACSARASNISGHRIPRSKFSSLYTANFQTGCAPIFVALIEPYDCDFLSNEESWDDAPGAGLAAESAPRTDPAGPLGAGFIDPAGSQSGNLSPCGQG